MTMIIVKIQLISGKNRSVPIKTLRRKVGRRGSDIRRT